MTPRRRRIQIALIVTLIAAVGFTFTGILAYAQAQPSMPASVEYRPHVRVLIQTPRTDTDGSFYCHLTTGVYESWSGDIALLPNHPECVT